MVTHRSLAALEDAQDQERRIAWVRIESAEQYLGHYRSRIDQVREAIYSVGAREGVAEDPGFREGLRRVSDAADEYVAYARRKVGELEDEYDCMLKEQDEQRERFLADQ